MTKEINTIVKDIVIETSTQDLIIQFETVLFLIKRPDLLGMCLCLAFFKQIGVTFRKQKELAEAMGMSEPTYIKKRNELVKSGILKIKVQNNLRILNLRNFSRLKFFKSVKSIKNMPDYLESMGKTLHLIDPEVNDFPLFSDNIYNIYSNKSNSTITNNKGNSTKGKGKTYPIKDYEKVLRAYMKYKGLQLKGPELQGARKAIKMMFQAERAPEEIEKFMKWLRDNEQDEEHGGWIRGKWNIWTVQKKISEFIGGAFGRGRKDDGYPIIRPTKKN